MEAGLKGLIDKIREEGIQAAEAKAKEIEAGALREAQSILENAKKESKRITDEASRKAADLEASGREALKQAARDFLISLRKEISSTLDKIVASHVHKALDHGELAGTIARIIKDNASKAASGVVVVVKKEDLEKAEKGFLAELRNELKKGISLKASDEIRGGFLISYDSGRSYYDFTDKALAAYISASLRPKLADILSESV